MLLVILADNGCIIFYFSCLPLIALMSECHVIICCLSVCLCLLLCLVCACLSIWHEPVSSSYLHSCSHSFSLLFSLLFLSLLTRVCYQFLCWWRWTCLFSSSSSFVALLCVGSPHAISTLNRSPLHPCNKKSMT